MPHIESQSTEDMMRYPRATGMGLGSLVRIRVEAETSAEYFKDNPKLMLEALLKIAAMASESHSSILESLGD